MSKGADPPVVGWEVGIHGDVGRRIAVVVRPLVLLLLLLVRVMGLEGMRLLLLLVVLMMMMLMLEDRNAARRRMVGGGGRV